MRSRPRFTLRSRRTVLVALIFATACVIAAILLTRKKEPSYGGYPLSNWVKLLSDINEEDFGPDCTQDQAPDAIVAIGTNALPFLVEWLQYKGGPTPVRDAVYKGVQEFPVLKKIHGLEQWAWKDNKIVRSAGAVIAFRILGATGAPAIPELFRMASKNPPGIELTPQHEAIEALTGIGETSLPALVSIATNRAIQSCARWQAASDIGRLGTNAAPAAPALLGLLEDEDLLVADGAAEALGEMGLEPRRVVPALTKAALRPGGMQHMVIGVLAKFGPEAAEAIPALQKIAAEKEKYHEIVRICAVSAISKIQVSNPPPKPPSP